MSVPDEYSVFCRNSVCGVYNVDGICDECLTGFINFVIKKKQRAIKNQLAIYKRIKRSDRSVTLTRRFKPNFDIIKEKDIEKLWEEFEKEYKKEYEKLWEDSKR